MTPAHLLRPDACGRPGSLVIGVALGLFWALGSPAPAVAAVDDDEGDTATPETSDPVGALGLSVDMFLGLGFGGELQIDFDESQVFDTGIPIRPVVAFGARAHAPIATVGPGLGIGVGGLGRLAFVRADGSGRQVAIDLDGSGLVSWSPQASPWVVYGTLALGLSLSFADRDLILDADTGVGWNLSPTAGVAYPVADAWAVFAELGMIHRNVNHRSNTVEGDFNLRQTQFTIQVGARYGPL